MGFVRDFFEVEGGAGCWVERLLSLVGCFALGLLVGRSYSGDGDEDGEDEDNDGDGDDDRALESFNCSHQLLLTFPWVQRPAGTVAPTRKVVEDHFVGRHGWLQFAVVVVFSDVRFVF